MRSSTDAELIAWAQGALDPDRAEEIAAQIAREPGLARRAAEVLRQPPSWCAEPRLGWCLPPPGLARSGALWARAQTAAVMGRGPLSPGARFEVALGAPPDPADRHVVVLVRREGDWVVVSPTHAREILPLAELPADQDGVRVLSLSAMPEPGLQRWAVVLAPLDPPVDWSAPPERRWSALMVQLQAGLAPAASVAVEVAI